MRTLAGHRQPPSVAGDGKQPTSFSGFRPLRQRKILSPLRLSHPGDKLEQEADMVAAAVMSTAHPALPAITPVTNALQRQVSEEEEEEELQMADIPITQGDLLSRKAAAGRSQPPASAAVEQSISSLAGGSPLAQGTRRMMESRFGHRFGDVRIHSDAQAGAAAMAINARAFTLGNHIGFAAGQYRPNNRSGQLLLAHELAHVIQQQGTTETIMRACTCSTGRRASSSEHRNLHRHLPRLAADNYCIIGPRSATYNCIAWSVSDATQWIWNQVDNPYGNADGTVTISDFDAFYWAKHRLVPTDYPNSNSVVALFANSSGPTHAALTSTGQPSCGTVPFTSKLGRSFLISHDLYELEGGTTYGDVVRYYQPG